MSAAPAGTAESVLVNVQQAAAGLVRAFDAEHSTRFEAALEALSPNTRRAYGGALAAWGRWAALQGVHALAAPPFALRAYLQERAAAGAGLSSLRLTVAALRKLQTLAAVEPSAHDQVVTDTLSGLAAAPRQAHALTAEALAVITATACQPRVGRGGWLESAAQARRRGLVDIALCRVLSDAGLRRGEAAALVWDDAARWDDGSGRLTRGPLEDRRRGAHRLPDAGVGGGDGGDAAGRCGREGVAVRAVRAVDLPPHPCRGRGGRAGVGFLRPFGTGGHGAAHGRGRRADA